MEPDWKRASHLLVLMLREHGIGLCSVDGRDGFPLGAGRAFLPSRGADHAMAEATPKAIRRWLWERRADPVWSQPCPMLMVRSHPDHGNVCQAGTIVDVGTPGSIELLVRNQE